MDRRYVITDVFTDTRFGGNQLAVVLDAEELTSAQMQAIAREFNFSETTFVLPPQDPANTRRVRIFTPSTELPFAGHPNVGTACVLAEAGLLGTGRGPWEIAFEEEAGLVRLAVAIRDDGVAEAELTGPRAPEVGPALPAEQVAAALGLEPAQILTSRHPPQMASAGVWFICTELADRAALAQARPNAEALAKLPEHDTHQGSILVFTRNGAEAGVDVHARMFAPGLGVPEDPATGAAAAALVGLLGGLSGPRDGSFPLAIIQGEHMGRPSRIQATAVLTGGEVTAVRVGGPAVPFASGTLRV